MNGKGLFIWKGRSCESGDLGQAVERAQALGLSWVALKIGDQDADHSRSYSDMALAVRAFRSAGLQVWAWHYVYGGCWIDFVGSVHTDGPSPEHEALFACHQVETYGFDGYIIDAEREYKVAQPERRAARFVNALRGIGVPVALSSYRYPSLHQEFPFEAFLELAEIHMPQVYWGDYANAPELELERSRSELKAIKDLPFSPIGRAYIGDGHANPKPTELTRFMEICRKRELPGCSFWSWDALCTHSGGQERAAAISLFDWQTGAAPEDPTPETPPAMGSAKVLANVYVRTEPSTARGTTTVAGKFPAGVSINFIEMRALPGGHWASLGDGLWCAADYLGKQYLRVTSPLNEA